MENIMTTHTPEWMPQSGWGLSGSGVEARWGMHSHTLVRGRQPLTEVGVCAESSSSI